MGRVEQDAAFRSDQIGLSLPSPLRLGVWYGHSPHYSLYQARYDGSRLEPVQSATWVPG